MSPLRRYGSLLLMALGLFALVLCGSVFYAGFAARQVVEGAQDQALAFAAELTAELGAMQLALRAPGVQEAGLLVLESDLSTARELNQALRSAGLATPLSVQVFDPVLEDVELGAYPLPDFTVLEMLLEARRAGSAMPELKRGEAGEVHLALAERLGDAADVRGVLFLRLPPESLIDRVAVPLEIDYLAVFQGLSEHRLGLWARGSRPARVEMREPLPETRLWLEWHQATAFPPAGLREAAITGLAGLALLLFGLRWRRQPRPSAQAAKRRSPTAAGAGQTVPFDAAALTPAARTTSQSSRPISPPPPPPPPPAADAGLEPDWTDSKPGDSEPAAPADDGLHLKLDENFFAGPTPAGFDGPAGGSKAAPDEPDDLVIRMDGPEMPAQSPTAQTESAPEAEAPAGPDPEPQGSEAPQDADEDALARIPPSPQPLPPDPVDESPALSLETGPPESPAIKPPEIDLTPQAFDEPDIRSGSNKDELSALADIPLDLVDADAVSGAEDSLPQAAAESPSDPSERPATADTPAASAELPMLTEPEPEPEPEIAAQPEQSSAAVVDPRLFTDAGILGRYDDGLDARSATLIGQALGSLLAERGLASMVVARDGRLHGAQLLASLVQGLRGSGIEVLDIGAVPTPVLNFAALERPEHAGVMVTGSHLPADWNGFHVVLGGEVLSGEGIRDLQRRIRDGDEQTEQGGYSEQRLVDRYVEAVTAQVQLERPLKVVADCGNGIAGLVVPRLLSAIGADGIPLYADVDGQFPNHVPDPSQPENLEDLRLCVRNFRADLGLAFDGDGDRLVIVGPDNDVLWPDRYAMLLARDLLSRQPGAAVVLDALCSPRLARCVEELGGRAIVSEAGPAGVSSRMRDADALLGVSFSGHVFLAESWNGLDDGLFAACRVLEVLAADTRDVGEILADFPSWISLPAQFVPTRPVGPEKILQQLLDAADVGDAEVGSQGGFSIDTGDAWGRVCRSADGTGLLVRYEGADESAAQRIGLLLRQLLSAVDERLKLPG